MLFHQIFPNYPCIHKGKHLYAIPPEIAFGGRHHPGVVANGEPPPISDVLAQLPPNPAPQPPPFTSSLIRPGVCVWTLAFIRLCTSGDRPL